MPKLEGIPAYIYSVLWTQQTYGLLKRKYPNLQVKIALLLTDFLPAILIKIDKGTFEIQVLKDVKEPIDLEKIECDGYFASTMEIFYGGPESIMKGIAEKKVKISDPKILALFAKLIGGE